MLREFRGIALGVAAVLLFASSALAKPNIVLITTDDQRADELSQMQTLQRELVKQGTTFTRAFAPFPLCGPSRASLMSGQHAHNHDVLANNGPLGGYSRFNASTTLATWMESAGYKTAFVGKYINDYGTVKPVVVPPGWIDWHASVAGGDYYSSHLRESNNGSTPVTNDYDGTYITKLYTDKAVEIVNSRMPSAAPLFLWVSYFAPHLGTPIEPDDPAIGTPAVEAIHRDEFSSVPLRKEEYDPSFNELDVSDKPSYIKLKKRLTTVMQAQLTELYQQRLESLQSVDEGIKRIVDAVRATGEIGNTIFVFTSDNGYMLGEHRVHAGKTVPYTPSARIPLIIRGPGFPAGVRRSQLAAMIDLSPTFLEAAQGTAGLPQDGISLFASAADPTVNTARKLLVEAGPTDDIETSPWLYRGIRTSRWMYIKYEETGEQELYDLMKDPYQLNNVISDPAYAAKRDQLANDLARLRNCAGNTC